jgi:hypothetical protein
LKLKNKAAWENCNRRGKKESVEERQRHRNTSIERHKESGRKRIQKSQKKKDGSLTDKKMKEYRAYGDTDRGKQQRQI